jgi:hypothetical protein
MVFIRLAHAAKASTALTDRSEIALIKTQTRTIAVFPVFPFLGNFERHSGEPGETHYEASCPGQINM